MPPRKTDKSLSDHVYFFHEGNDCRAYEFLGAHPAKKGGFTFRVYAPAAVSVSVVGCFNDWDRDAHPMKKLAETGGVWECTIVEALQFDAYKYSIEALDGVVRDKCDPYMLHAETRPSNASKVYDIGGYKWGDDAWQKTKSASYDRPVSIYELHLGSWRKTGSGEDGFYSYDMIADALVPYVTEMGFTHVEFMPVTEHPLDASWGYQCTGYFAATSRFGTPHDFMRLVDRLHQAGIGVILDWAPAHFPKDAHGLAEFDGSGLFEGEDRLMREHPDWGTRIFDYGRPEVRSFLLSSAMFWIEVMHVDGLRVDAVASMLYLDYGRSGGQWRPNRQGGRENLEAVAFFRKLSEVVFASHPETMLFAEESTAWPMVTKPGSMGGLGFNYKWNMGWMNDMMHYTSLDPYFRQFNHKDITFSFMYAFSENYLLPISHDEVVHGKHSLLDKMPGDYDEKFAGVRLFLTYMFAHPGKKLLFMGQEFGQFVEWNFSNELDWMLLGYEKHEKLRRFVAALNAFYRGNPELYEVDYSWEGFEWICHSDTGANTVSFIRRAKNGSELMFVINFSPNRHEGYTLGVSKSGCYKEIFNTDAPEFGGDGFGNADKIYSVSVEAHGRDHAIKVSVPAFGAVALRIEKEFKRDKFKTWPETVL